MRYLPSIMAALALAVAVSTCCATELYRSDFTSDLSRFEVLWTGEGSLRLDTEPRGVLKISSVDSARAAAGVSLEPTDSSVWRISLRARQQLTEGRASLVLQCFDGSGEMMAFIDLGSAPQAEELTPISRLLRLPESTSNANLMVMHYAATGAIWLADVKVEQVDLRIPPLSSPTEYGATGYLVTRDEDTLETSNKLMVTAGLDNARANIDWRTAEPQRGVYDFSGLERYLRLAGERGFKTPVVLVNGTPGWAHGRDPAVDMLPDRKARGKFYMDRAYWAPQDWTDWARFLHALFTHFKGRVAVWEILNEPDLWTEGFNGTYEDFRSYLRIAYLTARRVDPSCRVFCGALFHREWYQNLLDDGVGEFSDGFCIHPYASRPAESLAKADELILNLLDRGIDKPVWVTEIGYQTGGWLQGPGVLPDEETKARVGREVLEGLGRRCGVVLWYRAADTPRMFGLLEDRVSTLVPQPVYYAYGELTGRLAKTGGPIRLSVRPEPDPAVGRASSLILEATNTTCERVRVRLWPVGVTVRLSPGHKPLSRDWQGTLRPGETRRLVIPLKPAADAAGEHLVGIAALAEPANSLELVTIQVTDLAAGSTSAE